MYRNHTTRLDRFCARHPRFGIPNLMLYVAVGNIAISLMDTFSMGSVSLTAMLYFSRAAIFGGQVWRLLTFVLVPEASGLFWTAISALFYYWIGSTLEREWGTAKFNVFYFSGVLLNIVYGLVAGSASMYYVNLSLFFAFATLYGEAQVRIYFFIPVKVKWLAWLDAAIFVWSVIANLLVRNWLGAVLPLVAILNYTIFFWQDIRWMVTRTKRRTSPNVVRFKQAQKQGKKKAESQGYTHKCAVCGITDRDDPNMEFRYCSRCEGYHCYCMDHIANHIHIQE